MLFGRGVAKLDAQAASDHVAAEVPGFRAGEFALSADGRSAFVADARDGTVYLVAVRGGDLVTRKIARGYLKNSARDGAALNLRFSDFTFPKAAIAFADEKIAQDWERRLGA